MSGHQYHRIERSISLCCPVSTKVLSGYVCHPRAVMRPFLICALIAGFIAAVVLPPEQAAVAAPTCEDRNGLTIRCGTSGAMPVGWTLPAEERFDKQRFRLPQPSINEFLELICALGIFFGLMALLPEFEGRRSGDWDRQEGDDQERR